MANSTPIDNANQTRSFDETGIAATTREPGTGITVREPQIAPTTREPQVAPTTREPIAGTTTRESEFEATSRESAAGATEKEPESNPTTRESESGATAREPGSGATTKEYSGTGAPTTRESGFDQPGSASRPRINLPVDIAREYQWERDCETVGSESDNSILRSRRTGRLVFFKYYRKGFHPDPLAIQKLQQGNVEHVVKIINCHDDDENAWELQEYCELGSLKDWLAGHATDSDHETLKAIVRELSTALDHVHGLGVAHRDLKPANVLVRTEEPLDLVLTDFGLAKANQELTHVTQHMQGTWLYAAPEVYDRQSSARSDWFSLGAMIYEFYTGRHLFSDKEGNPEPNDVAKYRCQHRHYSTTAIEDDRWRRLVDGLLCFDREYRWDAKEVSSWLEGKNPHVHEQHDGPDYSTGAAQHQYYKPDWNDELIGTPLELVEALEAHWQEAIPSLAGRDRSEIITFLKGFPDTEQAIDILKSNSSPETKVIKLHGIFAPGTPPQYQGRELSTESFSKVIEAAADGDAESLRWLVSVLDKRILRAFSEASGNESAARADARLQQWHDQVEDVAKLVPQRQANRARTAFQRSLPDLFARAFNMNG